MIGRVSGKWSIQVTRRFQNSDGSFGGVVVASLNPEHFTKFYDRIDFGSSVSISLIGSDGFVRSSGGSGDGFALGQDLGGTKLFAEMHKGANTTFEYTDPSDGLMRLVTLRKVAGHPLWVSVSTDMNEIYRGSWSTLQMNAVAGIILTLIVLMAMERVLQTEEGARLKADQLRLTLENMSQGIMLVTKDLQIPIINGRCGELLDLPGEFIKSPPRFDELVEYQTRNAKQRSAANSPGEPARSAAAEHEKFAVCERTMPNGTVIEVRSGHLPDGSFVQTFTDITKRAEAEAHVARLASQDPLTGLPNRRVFRATLDQMSRILGRSRDSARLRRDVPRPRPLQGRQRHARSPDRGHAAPGGRQAPRRPAAPGGSARAARRRRVRHRLAQRRIPRRARSARRTAGFVGAGALRHQRLSDQDQRQHRHRGRAGGRRERRRSR